MLVKNWKRALLAEVILYVLIGVLALFTLSIPTVYLLLSYVVILVASYFYFQEEKPSQKEGLMLGVFFLIVSTILDIFFIGMMSLSDPSTLSVWINIYGEWYIILGILGVVILPALLGKYLEN